tara:strand:+ start:135 stop:542 length:408 start_codon:yes stop_codon:yes gene_type:complete
MALTKPKSMSELVYFTRRNDEFGQVQVWVFKEKCGKCGKAFMGKPVNPKTGKVKSRAKEYVCVECNHSEEKEAYEDSLTANIVYTCPEGHSGETRIPFKRKKISIKLPTGKNKRKDGISFECKKCGFEVKVVKLK